MADVPQFRDAVAFESKEVNERGAAVARLVLNVRMNGDKVAIFECVQYFHSFVGILTGGNIPPERFASLMSSRA